MMSIGFFYMVGTGLGSKTNVMRNLYLLLIVFASLLTGGCTVIESIFEAGLWAGIIGAIILVIIIFIVVRLVKKAGS